MDQKQDRLYKLKEVALSQNPKIPAPHFVILLLKYDVLLISIIILEINFLGKYGGTSNKIKVKFNSLNVSFAKTFLVI